MAAVPGIRQPLSTNDAWRSPSRQSHPCCNTGKVLIQLIGHKCRCVAGCDGRRKDTSAILLLQNGKSARRSPCGTDTLISSSARESSHEFSTGLRVMQPTPKVLPGYERAISPSYYAIGTASISPHLCSSGTMVCTSNMKMVMCHGKGVTTPSLRQIQCTQPMRSRV